MEWIGYSKSTGWVYHDRRYDFRKKYLLFVNCKDKSIIYVEKKDWISASFIYYKQILEQLNKEQSIQLKEIINKIKSESSTYKKIIDDLINAEKEKYEVPILTEKHSKFLKKENKENNGFSKNTSNNRVSKCYVCQKKVASYVDYECNNCGWLICFNCGACGCRYGYKKITIIKI